MPRKPAKQDPADPMDFKTLVEMIRRVDQHAGSFAKRAVNTSLTLRNWVFGLHLAEYELSGADRAEYGDRLFTELSQQFRSLKVSNTGRRQLYQYLTFYRTYPGIVRSLPAPFQKFLPAEWESRELSDPLTGNMKTPDDQNPIVRTVSALLESSGDTLLSSLSYSHFEQLIALDDPLKRAFYEIECLRGNWSVRALKRQIGSLFERSGLSLDKEKLSAMANELVDTDEPRLSIRDPYIFAIHDARGRQPTHRPPALHRQGSRPRRKRPLQHDQPPLRLQIPTRTPQQGSPSRVYRYQTQGGER